MFSTYEKLIIYCFSLLYLCLQCDEVFVTVYYLWIQHTVPQDPPKIKKKLITNFHQITSILYMSILLPYYTCPYYTCQYSDLEWNLFQNFHGDCELWIGLIKLVKYGWWSAGDCYIVCRNANQNYLAGNYEPALTLIHYEWKVQNTCSINLLCFL